MARWKLWYAVAVIGSIWVTPLALAANQEASSAEGTITAVDLSGSDPAITVQPSAGPSRTFRLGRIGALESLTVGSTVKLRYAGLKGAETIESLEVTNLAQPATDDSPAATAAPSPAASPAGTDEESDTSEESEKSKKDNKSEKDKKS